MTTGSLTAGRASHRSPFGIAVVVAIAVALVVVAPTAPAAADGNEAPGNPAAFRALTGGFAHACAILANGSVRCWGTNSAGILGLGDTAARGDEPNEMGAFLPAVNLGTGRTATALTAGAFHTCALLDNSTVKCWGVNTSGQLGLGSTATIGDNPGEMGDALPAVNLGTGRTATAITAGAAHTCALLDTNAVKCWGGNGNGQLGRGDTVNRGDKNNDMGDNLPTVALGTGRTATAISAGNGHTCARLDDATLKCWGGNSVGELGLGDTNYRGDAPGEMGNSLQTVALGTGRTLSAVSAGSGHTCALLDDNTLKCWGSGSDGRLGYGDTTTRGDGAGEMGDALPTVSLGTGRTVNAVSAGTTHTCARLDNNTVKCWGANNTAQLGLGDTAARGDGPGEMGDSLPNVSLGTGRTASAINANESGTCVTLDNAARKCWGHNSFGQLGQGDTAFRGAGAGQMGDNLDPVILPPAGVVSGTITDAVTAAPVPGAFVAVLRTTDFSLATSAVADGNGNYVAQAAPGTYYLYLLDPTKAHAEGFHGEPPTVAIIGDGGTADIDPAMTPNRGAFSGTVTDAASGSPLAGTWVVAIGPGGLSGATFTAANGTYTISGLGVGTYYAEFVDSTGRRRLEFWDDSLILAGATPFNVTAGNTTSGINAALARP